MVRDEIVQTALAVNLLAQLNLHSMRRSVYPPKLIRRFCVTNRSGSVTTTSVELENR